MKKRLIIIIPIVLLLLSFFIAFYYSNARDRITNLTISEKRWIENNNSEKVDIEIYNDYPVYAEAGVGVMFDLLNDFENDTNLEFNKVPYTKLDEKSNAYKIRVLSNDKVLSKKDILIAEDNYVALSTNKTLLTSINKLANKKVGILKEDTAELTYYLRSASNLEFVPATSKDSLLSLLENGEVNYIVVPKIKNMDIILKDNIYINYNFNAVASKLVLTLKEDSQELNDIVAKYFNNWKRREFVETYNKEYFDYLVKSLELNDKTKADLVSKTYVYGYLKNEPYEVLINNKMEGLAGEYLKRVQRLTGIEFEYKKYDSLKDLKKAMTKQEVDIVFNYFNIKDKNYLNTISSFDEHFVVLSNPKELLVLNSFEGLKGKTVNMMKDNSLYDFINNNSRSNVKTYDSLKDLSKSNGYKIVDKEIYLHHKNKVFKNLEVIYNDEFTSEYDFLVNKKDETLFTMLNHIMSTNSYNSYRINAINNLKLTIFEKTSFGELYFMILGIIALPLLITLAIFLIIKRRKENTEILKEDRRKYTDMLTSLKNRHYLSINIAKWDESKVYPQSVVIIDLNNIKYVNDNYGHEAGDNLIIKAAGILVNTQLENSEIMRTDGNEFLIYLVGYSEQQVSTYTKKLYKELKSLPHGFGAELGYSMILDDIKLLDDAINEATANMESSKETSK